MGDRACVGEMRYIGGGNGRQQTDIGAAILFSYSEWLAMLTIKVSINLIVVC